MGSCRLLFDACAHVLGYERSISASAVDSYHSGIRYNIFTSGAQSALTCAPHNPASHGDGYTALLLRIHFLAARSERHYGNARIGLWKSLYSLRKSLSQMSDME